MSAIIPAILPTSYSDLEQKLSQLRGLAENVQIDIVDGRFIGPASWPYAKGTETEGVLKHTEGMLPYLGEMQFEMDLMVADPERVTGMWIAAGASRLTIHAESTARLSQAIKDVQVKYGHSKDFVPEMLSMGLAINITTELSMIEPYLDRTDYVQFMGIATIGRQGEPFDERVMKKIAAFKRKYPRIAIQVDGGVSLETAPQLLRAGVDRLIVGSALWKAPSLAEAIEAFSDLNEQYTRYS